MAEHCEIQTIISALKRYGNSWNNVAFTLSKQRESKKRMRA